MSTTDAFTPHDLAVSAYDAGGRQLADARSRLPALEQVYAAAAARARATEIAMAALEREEKEAAEASTADRTDERIDHLVRVRIKLEHAVNDHVATLEAERDAFVAVTELEADIASLTESVNRARARVGVTSGQCDATIRTHVHSLASHVLGMLDDLGVIRDATAEDNVAAEQAGLPRRDGTHAAACLAEYLLGVGAAWGGNPHELRWALDVHGASETLADPFEAVANVFQNVVTAIRMGRAKPSDAPQHMLHQIADWAGARNKVEAEQREKARGTAEGQARQAELDARHAERLAKQRAAIAEAKGRPYSTSSNGARSFLGNAVRAAKRALSPQEMADRRWSKDRRPGVDGRPEANMPDGTYDPSFPPYDSANPVAHDAPPAAEPAPSAHKPPHYETPGAVIVDQSGPRSQALPHHETPHANVIDSSGPSPRPAPTSVRPGHVKSWVDGRTLPTRESLGDRGGEFIIADGAPSLEGPRGPDGAIERVAASRSTPRKK